MSRDYNDICKRIANSNDQIYQKETLMHEINSIKKDIDKLSKKLDKIYDMLVRIINGTEF